MRRIWPGLGKKRLTPAGVFSFIVMATDSFGCTGLGYTVTVGVPAMGLPTLSEWGMIIFMVLMGLGSIYYLRRKRMNI